MYCDWPVLGRCCFCMPLRKGVLVFGYINMVFCGFMIGLYSYAVHTQDELFPLYHGTSIGSAVEVPMGACVAIYCVEFLFAILLVLGAHQRNVKYIKIYYYFAITTTVASVLIQLIDILTTVSFRLGLYLLFEVLPLTFASMCIQIYLIILISSLLKQMEVSGPHSCENQLQQIVFEGKVVENGNGVYDTTVVPVDV